MKFIEKFNSISGKNSILCVGLDPDPSLIPPFILGEKHPILKFCREVVDATSDLVCGYKFNSAFFEASCGQHVMKELREYVGDELITIADVKRGDIGNTARMYAKAFFENMGFDAVTLNPYMGYDTIEPFASYKDKMSFILCLTSNPSSQDFEEQLLAQENVGMDLSMQPLWELVARKVNEWNKSNNLGLVVGATKPDAFKRIREITDIPILAPGIGKQGGEPKDILGYGGIIAAVSRSIIFASNDLDFAEAARKKTEEFVKMLS